MSLPLSATFDGSPPIIPNHNAVPHNVLSGLFAPELATTHLAQGVEEGFENDDVDLSFPRKRLDEEQQSGKPNGNTMLHIGGEGQVERLFVGYPDPDAEEEQIGGDPNVDLNASSFNPESRKRTRDATEDENGGGLGGVGLQPNILDMCNRQQQQQQQQQHTGVSPSSSNSPLANGTSKSTTTTTTTTTTTNSSTTGQTKTGNGDDFFAGFAPAKLAHVSVPPFKEEAVTIDPKTIPHVVLPKNYAIIGGKHLPDALPENGSQMLPMHSLFSEMQVRKGA
ncbi:hypothetical protein TL16_g04604 [Triparma laevis f. inornata]|uniref:Uncharacterized protein n=1 Tax=Triparma laevis f. inornata TaxID=1714386 RepID=A0A9W7AD03_9STRA|nr:hypothetical protein TL16_g04604 [Triparma laevis f. inornata]